MRYPSFIKPGDTIGFPAPSFGCATEPYATRFDAALVRFARMGYKVQEGPNARLALGIGKSNTAEKCAEELNHMYPSHRNQALISCGGGELMCEDLPFIDFEKIRAADPKWYMGFSDNTNFTYTLTTLCDTASVYGPCAGAFGMKKWHPSLKDAFSVLDGSGLKDNAFTFHGYKSFQLTEKDEERDPLASYRLNKRTHYRGLRPDGSCGDVSASGRLLGGCVDLLINMLGTPFDGTKDFIRKYRSDGILWFLECCDLTSMDMRRAIWQLKMAGWFQHASGFIIGRPLHYKEEMLGLDPYAAVYEPLKDLKVPVIFNADIGHLPPMIPIICGSMGSAWLEGQNLTLKMALE